MPRAVRLTVAVRTSIVVGWGLALLVGGACRGGASEEDQTLAARPDEGPSGRSISVPGDRPTVAAAVAAASPGDLILLSPGVYRERVEIDTPRLVLRGIDRTGVVFDGGQQLAEGIVVRADGVVVENLTVRRYLGDGIRIDGTAGGGTRTVAGRSLAGFRVSHVTAYANGGSGVHALQVRGGLIEATHARGHPVAGITVEACRPCDTVVTGSTAEANAVGFRAVDAGGSLFVVSSIWRANRVGVAVEVDADATVDEPAGPPAVVVGGNLVVDNANANAPVTDAGPYASGVVVSGPASAEVIRNRVTGHPGVGIAITDVDRRPPGGNEVRENVAEGNGTDLAFYLVSVASDGTADNCFAANVYASALPVDLETRLPCDAASGAPAPERGVRFPAPRLVAAPPAPRPAPEVEPPPPQPQLAIVTAPARPATSGPPPVDTAALALPPRTS